jgi:hypothetical protein
MVFMAVYVISQKKAGRAFSRFLLLINQNSFLADILYRLYREVAYERKKKTYSYTSVYAEIPLHRLSLRGQLLHRVEG